MYVCTYATLVLYIVILFSCDHELHCMNNTNYNVLLCNTPNWLSTYIALVGDKKLFHKKRWGQQNQKYALAGT